MQYLMITETYTDVKKWSPCGSAMENHQVNLVDAACRYRLSTKSFFDFIKSSYQSSKYQITDQI